MRYFLLIILSIFLYSSALAANYQLEITQPQPNLNTINRYYKAYPGVEYEVPVGVLGGLYPFTYSLTTFPSGMTIDASTGIITWSNPVTTGSPHNVAVEVTDAESNTDTVSWTITVTTSGFVFLDADAGSGGDGSINNPFDELADIWGDTGALTTYDNYFLYFREGTYGLTGGYWSACPGQQCKVHMNVTAQPHVWMGYPGETAIIDHDLASGSDGAYISLENGSDDLWFSNLKFQDMINHATRQSGNGDRVTIYNNIYYNGGPGVDGQNSSFIMFTGTSETANGTYTLVKDNVFDTAYNMTFVKSYSTNKAVHEGNTYLNPSGNNEGLAIKAYDQYTCIRDNTFDGDFNDGSISGNWNAVNNMDISFNKIINAGADFGQSLYGALTINYHDTAGLVHIYRNTIEGTVTARYATSDDGPFNLYNNVIVNQNAGTPSGSHVSHYDVSDSSRIVLGTGATANLVGYPGDNIIDTYGNLTTSYSSYIGTHGYQTTAATLYTLTLNKTITNGDGTVTSSPSGISCAEGSCTTDFASFNDETPVTLSVIDGDPVVWGGDCNIDGEVIMTENRTCTAVFEEPTQYTLTITKVEDNGSGIVYSDPGNIDCGTTCSDDFDENRNVDLTNVGDEVTWSGDCSGSGNITVNMGTSNKDCTATFDSGSAEIATYYVSSSGSNSAAGTTTGTAWQTISKVNSESFIPGDTILFRRGDTWSEQLVVPDSGTAGNYITFSAYGTGDKPILDGTGLTITADEGLLEVASKSYIIIDNIRVQDTGIEVDNNIAGMRIRNSSYITVQNSETYNTDAAGILFDTCNNIIADGNTIERACISSSTESLSLWTTTYYEVKNNTIIGGGNTINGSGSGIDPNNGSSYGTIHHNEVYNMENLATGIYLDAYNAAMTDIEVYANYVHDIDGGPGIGLGSEQGADLSEISIHHNIVTNCEWGALRIHEYELGIDHPMDNIYVYNNTFYNNGDGWSGGLLSYNDDVTNMYIKNNIISESTNFQMATYASKIDATERLEYTVDYNVFYGDNSPTGEWEGFDSLHPITTDPLFTSAVDFHLQSSSPAKYACDNSVWSGTPDVVDYDGVAITNGSGTIIVPGGTVSCGALEYVAVGTPQSFIIGSLPPTR